MEGFAAFLQDPFDDDRLQDLPDSLWQAVGEIMDTLLAQGCRPTPEAVRSLLGQDLEPSPDPAALDAMLMAFWWTALDEIAWNDPCVLQQHLERVPVQDHPHCYYAQGLLAGLMAVKWFGF